MKVTESTLRIYCCGWYSFKLSDHYCSSPPKPGTTLWGTWIGPTQLQKYLYSQYLQLFCSGLGFYRELAKESLGFCKQKTVCSAALRLLIHCCMSLCCPVCISSSVNTCHVFIVSYLASYYCVIGMIHIRVHISILEVYISTLRYLCALFSGKEGTKVSFWG